MKDLKHLALLSVMTLACGSLLVGCKVEQTEEGKMPDVDVQVEEGEMPSYDVEPAEVTVGSKEVDVNVPKIDVHTEEESVRVPTVDIDMPEDADDNDANNDGIDDDKQ